VEISGVVDVERQKPLDWQVGRRTTMTTTGWTMAKKQDVGADKGSDARRRADETTNEDALKDPKVQSTG